jgi:hypothetical protein
MTAAAGTRTLGRQQARLADSLVRWLETGVRTYDLFADGVFVDLSLPHWRLQTVGVDAAFGIREDQHPCPGSVRVEALDETSRGFLLRFEERWTTDGQDWYCREMIHCVVAAGRISEMLVYCTGDWDAAVQRRHAELVRLVRP